MTVQKIGPKKVIKCSHLAMEFVQSFGLSSGRCLMWLFDQARSSRVKTTVSELELILVMMEI